MAMRGHLGSIPWTTPCTWSAHSVKVYRGPASGRDVGVRTTRTLGGRSSLDQRSGPVAGPVWL